MPKLIELIRRMWAAIKKGWPPRRKKGEVGMANGRALFTPPAFSPLQFGLLSAAVDRTADAPTHWQAGITWPSYCPAGSGATYDPCLTVVRDSPDTTEAQPADTEADAAADKEPNTLYFLRGAIPFTVYTRVDCSPIGFWDNAQTIAGNALAQVEGRQVAEVFESGVLQSANGDVETIFPHLAANEPLIDSTDAVLQTAATVIGDPDTPYDVVEGLGKLEQALGECYGGQGVIHSPAELASSFAEAGLITRRGAQLASPLGHAYAFTGGYSGVGPDGTMTDDVAWVYATGAVFYLRSPQINVTAVQSDGFDRDKNTLEALVERTYVMGWDCCHIAVPITTGGVTAGAPDQAGEFVEIE